MKIKGSYLCFALLTCACIAVCAYAVADLFADLLSLVFLALLLVFACIGLWLKDALIGALPILLRLRAAALCSGYIRRP